MPCYCEICGREIADEKLCKTVVLDNAVIKVCPQCYQKLVKQGKAKLYQEKPIKTTTKTKEKRWVKTSVPKKMLETMYEVVEDYAERIRKARQKLGWTQAVLAQKVRVSENVIKRIESGRLKPGIELARRLEKILGIVLLEPIVEEQTSYSSSEEDYLTIGDLIRVDNEK
ncbi:MAG: TIGR00270 family protein [Desulfurococcales archaeon ex4484_58]|nr:MAG: TIGR00270 family protein [Desulfurococcales archaeon ex4484_58]